MNSSSLIPIEEFAREELLGSRSFAPRVNNQTAEGNWFTLEHLDFLIERGMLPCENIFAVRDGGKIPGEKMRGADGELDAAVVARVLSGEASFVVLSLQNISWEIRRIATSIASASGFPTHVNAYITPPLAQTLAEHTDPYSVVVTQVSGQKQWLLRESPDVEPSVIRLRRGDFLFVRKGTLHQARALDTTSVHLTFAIRDEGALEKRDSANNTSLGSSVARVASRLEQRVAEESSGGAAS